MDDLHNVSLSTNAFLQLLLTDHKRRSHLEHHEVVSADLRENLLVREKAHHEDLAKQGRMNRLDSSVSESTRLGFISLACLLGKVARKL
jgi:hypothetical protein